MNEGAIEPLDVIVFGEGKEDLVTDDGEGQQEDGASRHCQGEGAQVQTAKETSNALNTVAQLIFILKINPIIVNLFICPISAPVLQLLSVCILAGG